ncbi:Predicted nucleotidyltransferase [Desulfonatronum thiosulfatophilum]|uniref:Predicted nucleotidyltransferase n=1 Tax=Desulfonatronum thiosulfatophilum TaxID=617002 RepID=A0A1G6EHT5_9BACT|nr:nucleotidyltransferase domain-containing protein [Desulfonatronum thiosulfatophilum]SDB56981.1 Predicted nucleotidyltransferase [Desulfonatronum thiosulfatophilum]
MIYGLQRSTVQQINNILARHPKVRKAMLYGSRAKGTQKTGSDIDLTLIGDLDLKELYLIMDELDDLLLPYSIDLSLYHDIDDPDVVEHIQRVGKVFYEQDPQSTFET